MSARAGAMRGSRARLAAPAGGADRRSLKELERQALFEFLGNKISASDQERLRAWIAHDLQHWRHDREAAPRPPSP